jgi:hypothetical protein
LPGVTLYESFLKSLQDTNSTCTNSYLLLLSNIVKDISDAGAEDLVLEKYNREMTSIASSADFAIDATKVNSFAQKLGEAHFYLICKNRGINLERVSESPGTKTPDFCIADIGATFEVKTLSVTSGDFGIQHALNDSVNANVRLESQLKEGKGFAYAETALTPYGEIERHQGMKKITTVIETIIDKLESLIKPGQFSGQNASFLVVNLCLLPPIRTDALSIRPYYVDTGSPYLVVSGELWMAAFVNTQMPIVGVPEFEGKPSIEGFAEREGILRGSRFSMIDGILFMVYPLSDKTDILGVYDSLKWDELNNAHQGIAQCLQDITNGKWNDSLDSNGWALQS